MSAPETIVCPACHTHNPGVARFCMQCGTALTRHCPACRVRVSIGAQRCDACGWTLTDATPQPLPVQGGGLASPLVGRATELSVLLRLSTMLHAGVGRAVLITGEPGLGKSRLIAEWKALVSSTSADVYRWIEGRCLPYGQEIAYHLLVALLRALLNVPATAQEGEVQAALHSLESDVMPAGVASIYPYIGHLLGLQMDDRAREQVSLLEPQALQNRYFTALRDLLRSLSYRHPLVLILEDIHWADPSSVDLLIKLLPLTAEFPLLLCIIARNERDVPGWKLVTSARELLGSTLIELPLSPLSAAESQQLVTNLLAQSPLPHYLRDRVLEKADGNPFFMEEIIRMLLDRGILVQQNGQWMVTTPIDRSDIPDTLQELLLARTCCLSIDVQQTVRVAAVIGRQFPVKVLAEVLHQVSRSELQTRLATLETTGLLQLLPDHVDLEYRFRHALMQEAVYAPLPETERTQLHLAVGEALEKLYPERRDEFAPELARHFTAAGACQRALHYTMLAGDVSLAAYANQEAEAHYRAVLSLPCATMQRGRACAGLGRALARQSRYREAIEVWCIGIEHYQSLGDTDMVAELYAFAGRAAWYGNDAAHGLRVCQEGLTAVADAPESPGLAALIHEAGRAYHFNDQPEPALHLCQRALDISERLGVVDVQAETLSTLGILLGQPPEQSLAALHRAVELSEASGLLGTAARAHLNLCWIMVELLGDLPAAYAHLERALALSRRQGVAAEEFLELESMAELSLLMGAFHTFESLLPLLRELVPATAHPLQRALYIRFMELDLLFYRGQWDEAHRGLCLLQADLHLQEDRKFQVTVDTLLAQVLIELGNWEEADQTLRIAIARNEPLHHQRTWLHYLHCCVLIHQGQLGEARRMIETIPVAAGSSLEMLDRLGWLQVEAHLAAAEGNCPRAIDIFAALIARVDRLGMLWWHARLLLDLAEAYRKQGAAADLEQVQDLLDDALARFRQLGASGYVALTEERLEMLHTQLYLQAIAHQQTTQELSMAASIQSGLLPGELPHIPGWQLAAALHPARETAGDFYDCMTLPDGRIAIVVADVVDKGLGAALYMALGRTLIRIYASEYPGEPEQVLQATNQRLIKDTPGNLFITTFYGILIPTTGSLLYSNAGHNPPYLLRAASDTPPRLLYPTGMLLGVTEDGVWEQSTVQLSPGDKLILYTDGLIEAQNHQGAFFGEERLRETIQMSHGLSAQSTLDLLLEQMQTFVDSAPRYDDITLMVVVRETDT